MPDAPDMPLETQQSSVNDEYYTVTIPKRKNWIALKPEQLSPRQFTQLSGDPDQVFSNPKEKALSLLKLSEEGLRQQILQEHQFLPVSDAKKNRSPIALVKPQQHDNLEKKAQELKSRFKELKGNLIILQQDKNTKGKQYEYSRKIAAKTSKMFTQN